MECAAVKYIAASGSSKCGGSSGIKCVAEEDTVKAGSSEDDRSLDMQQCSGATVNSFVKAESSKGY